MQYKAKPPFGLCASCQSLEGLLNGTGEGFGRVTGACQASRVIRARLFTET